MPYHKKHRTATKEESRAIRSNTRALVKALPKYQSGEWFTRAYVQAEMAKEPSVITMCLRDMEERHEIVSRKMDDRGTLAFRSTLPQLHWRPTHPDPECQPKYF